MLDHRQGPSTARIILRALTVEDAASFYALNSHPDVMRYTGESPLSSLEQAREAIQNYPDWDRVGYGRWGCVLKDTQQVIGFCGLKYLEDLNAVDLGYRFMPQYWGRGLATEVGRASIEYGFDVLQLNRILGLVLPANLASIRVLEKVGMRLDGAIDDDGQLVLSYYIDRNKT